MKLFFLSTALLPFSLLSAAAAFQPGILDLNPGSNAVVENRRLILTLPENSKAPVTFPTFRLNLKPYRAEMLTGRLRFKARLTGNLNNPKAGIRLRLSYPADDNSHERLGGGFLQARKSGSGLLPGTISLDPHAESCRAELRLEHCTGRVEFDLDSLLMERLFRKENRDHICEYSDAVKNRPLRRGVMSPITDQANEENFKVLRSWNVNLMRLQLNTSDELARTDLQAYRKFIDTKINDVIPRVLDLGKKYGVMIIIDLHTVPGSARMTEESDAIYGNEAAVNEFLHIWRRIAAKFKGHPALYGYDLINEPKQTRRAKTDYLELQRRAAEAIREIDPETPIYIESNHLCSPYTYPYLSPLKLKNIIYQLHSYDPFVYTHTRFTEKDRKAGKTLPSYPGKFLGANWDFESLKARLRPVREFQRRHQAKIYVGEFSARACAPGAERYLEDSIRAFEEAGWDWTYHAFREAKIWSLEYAGPTDDTLVPSNDNPRKRILLNAFRRNRSSRAPGCSSP